MAEYQIPYGQTKVTFTLAEDRYDVDWIEPAYTPPASDPLKVVRLSLENPVDGKTLSSYRDAKSVIIAINDKTRPVPHEHLLPPLLEYLHAIGIPTNAIRFMIATGTHLPMTPSELDRILPKEISTQHEILSHNCDDEESMIFCGTTTRGTPVWANRDFHAADLRIVVGNIEPHHFAGFSGGYKTAAIGLAGRKTITHNHAMLVEPEARIASYSQNPLRQDIEEIGDRMGVDFALNAVLNGDKKIVHVVSGSPREVMRAGIPFSQQVCQIPSRGSYDLVIASVGGAPKDINFYQSQKALTHASLLTRDGGAILLAAACPEGSGNLNYERFMEGLESPQAVFQKFRQMGFVVGPHKAFQVARDAARVKIVLYSEIPPDLVSRLLMTPATSIETALSLASEHVSTQSTRPRVAILPRATNTIPAVTQP